MKSQVNVVLLLSIIALCRANYLKIYNYAPQPLALFVHVDNFEDGLSTIISSGNFTEIMTLDEWVGDFYTYPLECLDTEKNVSICDYPVTKARVAFEREVFNAFFDFYLIDLSVGFNVPATIRSLDNPDGCQMVTCDANLLNLCPEEDQIKNEKGTVVSCKTSENNYRDFQEACPQSMVNGNKVSVGVCMSADWELSFG